MVSSILSEDEKVNSSITDICSPNTTYLDLCMLLLREKENQNHLNWIM